MGRRGPGRPAADGADRRTAILDAAREEFGAHGYDGATIRGIARRADVDPALVHHYLGSKEQLFVAAMQLPFDPSAALPALLEGSLDGLGERLVRFFLHVWDDPVRRAPFLAVLGSAMTNEQAAVMLREFVSQALLARLVSATGEPIDPLRVQAAVGQLIGVALMRHVVGIEPLASASGEDLVALLAPTVQAYLVT